MFIQQHYYYHLALAGASLASSLLLSPLLASAVSDYFTLENAKVQVDESTVDARLETSGIIPQDGQSAYGYGILTGAGNEGIIVSTTHAGVLDSELQRDASDPVWHNHFVKLDKNVSGRCGDNLEVVDITMESPGEIQVRESRVVLDDIPFLLEGTSAMTKDPLTLAPGASPQQIVSFAMDLKFDGGTLKAVCITNITPAEDADIEREQEGR
ncbi:hypothetical protein NTE_03243 [Candidatus Nitrososphaera evergladensis SR1]|jgi:hypothetical protein|uniref:Uncharacterized protein n=2 Tax=Nitrososphaera TaxID=497726 RepID=A0A075MXC7_9ARCH|nr:hypothetical protein NTE_03243 [Candidatus Nitrososphaera evergladensis SR1]